MKRPVNPASLAPPVGFAHGWLVEHGEARTLYLAGQCGYDQGGRIESFGDLAAQFERAMRNAAAVLREAGMSLGDLVQLNLYVRNRRDYATARREFGRIWKEHCGRHFPAMAMFEVASLFDEDALIEVQGIAAC
ncbi:MAG: RidA family protein [Planctomycetota bacterium]